jgi:DNA-binding response OmpR family regulator
MYPSHHTTLGFAKATIALIDTHSDQEFTEHLMNVQQYLVKKGYDVQHVASINGIHEAFMRGMPHIILCHLAVASTLQKMLMPMYEQTTIRPDILLMSKEASMQDIRYAMKIGADDCLAQSTVPEMVAATIEARIRQ